MPASFSERLAHRFAHQLLGQRDVHRERVFVTGLSRTGTTSITRALETLGYRTIHWPPMVALSGKEGICLQWPWWLEAYDAFTDIPVTGFYKELDQRFPNARFIETVRPKAKWLRSCSEHFSVPSVHEEARRLHLHIYGADVYDEALFARAFDRHAEDVRDYFRGRANFLEFSVTEGDGWKKLCSFLDKSIPVEPFPFENAAVYFRLSERGQERLGQRLEAVTATGNLSLKPRHDASHNSPPMAPELLSLIQEPGAVLHLRKWGYAFDALDLQLDTEQDLVPR